MVAHNHPQQDLTPSAGVSEDSYSVLTYINKINEFKKKKKNSDKVLKCSFSQLDSSWHGEQRVKGLYTGSLIVFQ